MVERQLPKLNVAGSIPVSRSMTPAACRVERGRAGRLRVANSASGGCPKAVQARSGSRV